jgi:hypothetical protein
MDNLPPIVYAVPGQHDQPEHRTDQLHRSAFGTLVRANRIIPIPEGGAVLISPEVAAFGFGWGTELVRRKNTPNPHRGVFGIAVVHAHVYVPGADHFGVSPDADISLWGSRLKGYHAAVFGDNHKGFTTKVGTCSVLNCGGMYCANSDERLRRPWYGMLHDDGEIETRYFDTSHDVWEQDVLESAIEEAASGNLSTGIIRSLAELSSRTRNYPDALRAYIKGQAVPGDVVSVLNRALEGVS